MERWNKIKLYLDDIRTPISEDWTVVRNYDELVSHIRMNGLGSYETISLDHDLGEDEAREKVEAGMSKRQARSEKKESKTGYDAAKWLVAESMTSKIPLPQIYCHSANPVGAENIIKYMNNYFKNCMLPQTCVQVNIPHNS